MAYYPKDKRNFSHPSLKIIEGNPLQGLDPDERSSLATANYLQNLWRDGRGNMVRRPGAVCVEQIADGLQIVERSKLGGNLYYVCFAKEGYYIGLRSANGGWFKRSVGQKKPCMISRGASLIIVCEEEWILADVEGKITILSKNGSKDASVYAAFESKGGFSSFSPEGTMVSIPLVRVGSRPMGQNGKKLQQVNMLSPFVQESFCYTDEDKQNNRNRFCLDQTIEVMGALPVSADGSTDNLSAADQLIRVQTLRESLSVQLRVQKTDAMGNLYAEWQPYTLTYKDHINASASAVWLSEIRNYSLMQDGEDNLRLLYRRKHSQFSEDFLKLCGCTLWSMHGVGGYKDRLFLSGSAQMPDSIWYSHMDDMLYFGAYDYVQVGTGEETVMALAGQDTRLWALCAHGAYLVTGHAASNDEGYVSDALFTVSSALSLPAPVAGSNAVVAGGEVLFLTKRGVAAVSTSGVLDERCIKRRSGRLDDLLAKNLSETGVLCTFGDYLILSDRKGNLYLLDLLCKVPASDTHSSFGYAAYYWTALAAEHLWVEKDQLYFCSQNAVYRLDAERAEDQRYDGKITTHPISVVWQTPSVGDARFDRCSSFEKLALWLAGENASVRLYVRADGGEWQMLRDYGDFYSGMQYSRINYRRWTYQKGKLHLIYRLPLKIRHCRRIEFRLENDRSDHPFGLQQMQLEYK